MEIKKQVTMATLLLMLLPTPTETPHDPPQGRAILIR